MTSVAAFSRATSWEPIPEPPRIRVTGQPLCGAPMCLYRVATKTGHCRHCQALYDVKRYREVTARLAERRSSATKGPPRRSPFHDFQRGWDPADDEWWRR